ncbi:hypothetical protein ASD52_30380 [Ensifer sp. Root142]|nr:hypothetical protein ASD52_30380 [Ensifer sp. Root142]
MFLKAGLFIFFEEAVFSAHFVSRWRAFLGFGQGSACPLEWVGLCAGGVWTNAECVRHEEGQ